MITFEKTEVMGWEAAIRGMRNPMNSWEKSDSLFFDDSEGHLCTITQRHEKSDLSLLEIGDNDHDLMMRLAKGGPVHAKYRRMIEVYVDITAPLYWWKEFDTYKVGTVANSCSTMHKIHAKPFEASDFSLEHLFDDNARRFESDDCFYKCVFDFTLRALNDARMMYLYSKDKKYWWQMIQLLPTSYNQKRTVMLSYEVLVGIYRDRKNHKLDEWHDFCHWIEDLPYPEVITLEEKADGSHSNR